MLRLLAFAGLVISIACSANENSPGGAAGLVTAFDSTGDTIVARVDGQVPVSALRAVNLVMRIQPTVDDTSLFAEIGEIEVDGANRVWVYDYRSRQVFLFDSSGALIRRVGRQGAGPGEFAQGNGIAALPDTGIAVLDSQNSRVSFFSANGDFRSSFLIPAGFSTNNGLFSDRSGTLYLKRPVTPPREGEILGRMGLVRLGADGAFGDSLLPVDIPVPRDTYIAVSGGGRSSTSSSFAPNYYWDWHPDGYFVAGDGGRYEVIIERKGAKPVVIRRNAPSVPIVSDERNAEKESITWSMRRTQPDWTWTGPEIPETKAPLQGILVARDGNIWARVATNSEKIPENELPPQRENGPPVGRYRSPNTYEVFAPDGRFLGRVPLPPKTSLVQADGEYLWGIMRDSDEIPSVVRFRLSRPF